MIFRSRRCCKRGPGLGKMDVQEGTQIRKMGEIQENYMLLQKLFVFQEQAVLQEGTQIRSNRLFLGEVLVIQEQAVLQEGTQIRKKYKGFSGDMLVFRKTVTRPIPAMQWLLQDCWQESPVVHGDGALESLKLLSLLKFRIFSSWSWSVAFWLQRGMAAGRTVAVNIASRYRGWFQVC